MASRSYQTVLRAVERFGVDLHMTKGERLMTTIAEVEDLVRRHEIDAALEELGRMLEERPDDAEARMLFGVCQQMRGRTESFCEIYRDLAPSMSVRDSSGADSPVVSRWRHYCKVAAYLVAIGVITLAGTGCALNSSSDRGITIETKSSENAIDMPKYSMGGRPMTKYNMGGRLMDDTMIIDVDNDDDLL